VVLRFVVVLGELLRHLRKQQFVICIEFYFSFLSFRQIKELELEL
jgi:hypothetical protein